MASPRRKHLPTTSVKWKALPVLIAILARSVCASSSSADSEFDTDTDPYREFAASKGGK